MAVICNCRRNLLGLSFKRMLSTRSIRFRRSTVVLAILGLVYSYGVCPGGCLEENQWYAAVHCLFEHDDHLPGCAHESDPGEHCDCDQEADSALLVNSRSIDADVVHVSQFVFNIATITVPFDSGLSAFPHRSERRTGPPMATLRAQCQLFRC